jgi:hypothetical protein
VGVVDQPVEDGIATRGVADHCMLVIDGQLAGDQGGPAADAVLDQLQEIPPFPVAERGQPPVVEDQEVRPREGVH